MTWVVFALTAALIFGIQDILKKRVLKKEHSFEFLTILNSFCYLAAAERI